MCSWKIKQEKVWQSNAQDKRDLGLWGPARTQSHAGKRYFMTLTDDFSTRVWVYFLRSKDEALQNFEHWLALVEN